VRDSLPRVALFIRPISYSGRSRPQHVFEYVMQRVAGGETYEVPSWLGMRWLRGGHGTRCTRTWHRDQRHRARIKI